MITVYMYTSWKTWLFQSCFSELLKYILILGKSLHKLWTYNGDTILIHYWKMHLLQSVT